MAVTREYSRTESHFDTPPVAIYMSISVISRCLFYKEKRRGIFFLLLGFAASYIPL